MQTAVLIQEVSAAIDIIMSLAMEAMRASATDTERHGWSMVLFELDHNIRRRVEKLNDPELFGKDE